MAESKDPTGDGYKAAQSESDFKELKDDYVAGVGEESVANVKTPASAAIPVAVGPTLRDRIAEPPDEPITVTSRALTLQTRRDFLIYAAGIAGIAAGFWWLLPDETRARALPARTRMALDSLDARLGLTRDSSNRFFGRVLTFDDDVAEALYSPTRMVPTYDPSLAEKDLRNNYDGQTPAPDYIPSWTLTLSGLASGKTETLTIQDLLSRFARHDQVTRMCCVEGWSAIAAWGGLRFADLLKAYPPAPGLRWIKMDSSVNLDGDGNADPYYVSIDIPTAEHPQSLLATHLNGKPLDVEHGAPLRLVVPMKLGLKNIKAITAITYTATQPPDYWNERGYSKYDGV